jgi:membrane-bound ClpP family serine protease
MQMLDSLKKLSRRSLVLAGLALAGVVLAIVLAALLLRGGGEDEVLVARIDGAINNRTAAYVERVISEGEEAGARAVVFEIDTPGGRLDSTQRIVQAISNARDVPVIAYVAPQGAQAASAGTFIVLASDVAAMAPQTRIGAAQPVTFFGGDIPGDIGEKVTNDTVALVTGLAEAHGRNAEWAERAVRESASEDASEALELNVVDYVEPDLELVLEAADGTTVEPKDLTLRTAGAALVERPMSFAERWGIPSYLIWAIFLSGAVLLVVAAVGVYRSFGWRVTTGTEGMIGEIGYVRTPVVPGVGGQVFVHGERWRAVPEDPDSAPLPEDTEVEIVGFEHGRAVVRPRR